MPQPGDVARPGHPVAAGRLQRSREAVKYKSYSRDPDALTTAKVRAGWRRQHIHNDAGGGQGAWMAQQNACSKQPVKHHLNGPQLPPSALVAALTQPSSHEAGWRPRPEVLELLSICEHSHQARVSAGAVFEPYATPDCLSML